MRGIRCELRGGSLKDFLPLGSASWALPGLCKSVSDILGLSHVSIEPGVAMIRILALSWSV